MNKEHLKFHLREALDELSTTISQLEVDPEYSEEELSVAMQHLYHHLNTAWNSRNIEQSKIEQASDGDFNNWGAYPLDLPTMII